MYNIVNLIHDILILRIKFTLCTKTIELNMYWNILSRINFFLLVKLILLTEH